MLKVKEKETKTRKLNLAHSLCVAICFSLTIFLQVPFHDYKYTVNVGEDCIRVTGSLTIPLLSSVQKSNFSTIVSWDTVSNVSAIKVLPFRSKSGPG